MTGRRLALLALRKYVGTVVANPAPTRSSAALSTGFTVGGSALVPGDVLNIQIEDPLTDNCNGSADVRIATVAGNVITWDPINDYGCTHSGGGECGYPIASVATGNPATITTTVPHGMLTGEFHTISGTTTTPSINASQAVTVTGATTFTIPVTVTSGQAAAAGQVGTAEPPMVAGRIIGGTYYCNATIKSLRQQYRATVYDPADVGGVVTHALAPSDPTPKSDFKMTFTGIPDPLPGTTTAQYNGTFITFDPVAKQLLIAIQDAVTVGCCEKHPRVYVYNVP